MIHTMRLAHPATARTVALHRHLRRTITVDRHRPCTLRRELGRDHRLRAGTTRTDRMLIHTQRDHDRNSPLTTMVDRQRMKAGKIKDGEATNVEE